jgi:PTH1 family peptidyl-tRNA hydrolase
MVMCRVMVVGLGNPGEQYRETRHNLGFRVVERFYAHPDIRVKKAWRAAGGSNALVAEATCRGKPVILVKPLTFVNRSGEAVGPLAIKFRVPAERILVVCDDLALPPGTLRRRARGSSGGHNGLQSLIDRLGEGFARLRVGIGSPAHPGAWADYVLERFSPEEEAQLPAVIDGAVREITGFILEVQLKEAEWMQ